MRRVMILGSLVLAASGCTDDSECLHGSCPGTESETRHFPGPCTAATDAFIRDCRFEYDAALHLARAACTSYGGFEDELEEDIADYGHDASGQLTSIVSSHRALPAPETAADRRTWTWTPTTVDVAHAGTIVGQYDRALFALYPATPIESAWPRAELGLVRSGDVTFAWSRAGNQLTRTSSKGEIVVFTVDDAGRLLENSELEESFTYDGDRVATRRAGDTTITYHYDRGGNLIDMTAESTIPGYTLRREVYDYRCWDAP